MHRTFRGRGALRSDACNFGFFCSYCKDTVSSEDGFAPFLRALLLDADLDADVRIAFVLAAKVGGYEVALLRFYY